MNSALAKLVFLAVERVRGEHVGRFLRELEGNQRLPLPEIKRLQAAKLDDLLRDVLRKNDYYRRKYSGFKPLEDFSGLPVLTKQELRENYQRIVTPGAKGKLDLGKTSGSTGEPLKFYRDRRVFGYTLASVYRAHRWHGLDIGAKEAMLWGIPSPWGKRMRMHARDFLLNRFREAEYSLEPRVLLRFHRDIVRRRPAYLLGYSSMVYEFALFLDEASLSGRELGLKAVVCTAESIPDYQRRTIEHTFGCQVVSEYGSAETGIIAYECPRRRHHVSDDCVLVEVVGEDFRPVPAGEMGAVLVTVLNSHSAPIIRYQLGDLASLSAESCDCGVTLPLIGKLVGRTGGVIVTPQGKCFHSIAVYYIMKDYTDKYGGIRQFRVRQTHVDRLEFHLATGRDFSDEARQWLERKARDIFGSAMRIEMIAHERLERTPAGKLIDFESCLDENDHLIASYRRSPAKMITDPT